MVFTLEHFVNSVQQYHLFVSAAPKQDRNLKMKTLLPESIYILKLPIDFLIFLITCVHTHLGTSLQDGGVFSKGLLKVIHHQFKRYLFSWPPWLYTDSKRRYHTQLLPSVGSCQNKPIYRILYRICPGTASATWKLVSLTNTSEIFQNNKDKSKIWMKIKCYINF